MCSAALVSAAGASSNEYESKLKRNAWPVVLVKGRMSTWWVGGIKLWHKSVLRDVIRIDPLEPVGQ